MSMMQEEIVRRSVIAGIGLGALAASAAVSQETTAAVTGSATSAEAKLRFGTKQVGDVTVFYREAGRPDAPVLLLLHGFPTAGHMFRDLMPLLADRHRVIAPDLAGFGNTVTPPRASFG